MEILRIGENRPPRIKVRFLDDRYEGREEWVKPVHLRTPWVHLEEFTAREERWSLLMEETWSVDDQVMETYLWFFQRYVPRDIASIQYNLARRGALMVLDSDALFELMGKFDHELAFEEEGEKYFPGTVALDLSMKFARTNSRAVLLTVREVEAEERRAMVHGTFSGKTYIDPEIIAGTYEEYLRPILERVEGWCEAAVLENWSEIALIREDLALATQLVNDAVHELLEAGLGQRAFALHQRMYPNVTRASWRSVVDVKADAEQERKRMRDELWEAASSKRWTEREALEIRYRRDLDQLYGS